MNYYNENDPYPAQWLRNLIAAGLIPQGDVDERSIADVQGADLCGYTQCHFFAGIGGWPIALRLAGWPATRPVWTGSCPCQPFSVAGTQAGFDDPRHLWPQFRRLIDQRRPATVLGEQVAGASDWLRLVRGDLEALDYAVGAVPMEAASADADHFRDRYWFVAHGQEFGRPERDARAMEGNSVRRRQALELERCGGGDLDRPVADFVRERPYASSQARVHCGEEGLGARHVDLAGLGSGLVEHAAILGWGEGWTEHEFRSRGFTAAVASIDDCQYVECPDGKWRRLPPPGVRWLGNGIPARVAKLRAFGNAIDPRPAAAFIKAVIDCLPGDFR